MIEFDCSESTGLNPSISAESPFTIQWMPSDNLSCDDCLSPFIMQPANNQVFQITIQDNFGCSNTATIQTNVDIDKSVYSPNVFSANDDGVNDQFTLYGTRCLKKIRYLKVFDRWGELIFIDQNFPANDGNYGWSGDFRGEKINSSLFIWLAEVEFFDGSTTLLNGDVLVIR